MAPKIKAPKIERLGEYQWKPGTSGNVGEMQWKPGISGSVDKPWKPGTSGKRLGEWKPCTSRPPAQPASPPLQEP
jgi:hypothetical protein